MRAGCVLRQRLLGMWKRRKAQNIPIRSSPPGISASRGVSGGVSMPFSRGVSSTLLGASVSVVVTGAVGADGPGAGWPLPKK